MPDIVMTTWPRVHCQLTARGRNPLCAATGLREKVAAMRNNQPNTHPRRRAMLWVGGVMLAALMALGVTAYLVRGERWSIVAERTPMELVRYSERRLEGHPNLQRLLGPALDAVRRSQEREPPANLPTLGKGQRPYALAAAGVFPLPIQIFSWELRSVLNSPLCRLVQNPRPGDLGMIRLSDPKLNNHDKHGFVYISPTVRYAKVNSGPGAPVKFEIGTRYGSGDTSIGDYNYDMNSHLIEYWRCSTLEDWGRMNADKPVSEAIAALMSARNEFLNITDESSAQSFPKVLLRDLDRAIARLPESGVIPQLIRKQAWFLKESIKEIGLGLPLYCLGPECPPSCRPLKGSEWLTCLREEKN